MPSIVKVQPGWILVGAVFLQFACSLPAAWAQTQHAAEAATSAAVKDAGAAAAPSVDASQVPPAPSPGPQATVPEQTPAVSSTQTASGSYEAPAPPPLPDDPQSLQLIKRVDERWAALIAGDFAKVYAFETPEYRGQFSLDQFRAGFGPNVKWHGATVKELVYDRTVDATDATVGLWIEHSYYAPWRDDPVRGEAMLKETWVKVDGTWWRKPLQLKLGMPASGVPSGKQ